MNIERLRELTNTNHLMAVELEADDYGYRQWFPRLESEVDEFITSQQKIGYSLSDIDHHANCPCLASWDEWCFLLDIQALTR